MTSSATPPALTALLPWDTEGGLPAVATGDSGLFRSSEQSLISAGNDLEAVSIWLANYADSPNTLAAYRKELERLLLWASETRGKPLSSLTTDDYLAYRAFLADPQPRERWCGPKVSRRDPRWRPFAGPLSARSVRQALAVINTLLTYLVSVRYLSANPLALTRGRNTAAPTAPAVERVLDHNLWEHVLAHVEDWPQSTPTQRAHYERARWLLAFLYATGPRVSEIASHTMGSIYVKRGRRERWWWQVRGKGGRVDRVPLGSQVIDALVRYRQHLGLPALPSSDERMPLVCRLSPTARENPLTRAQLYQIVKSILTGAAADIEAFDRPGAATLRQASTHWLRHTAINHLADRVQDVRVIQRFARHANLSTTSGYLHSEEDDFHSDVTAEDETERARL